MPSVTECAASLAPQVFTVHRDRSIQNAWLRQIAQSSFEDIKRQLGIGTGGSAGLPIEGVPAQFSGFFNGNWNDFQQRRATYLSTEAQQTSEIMSEALFRQSLTSTQLDAWKACVTQNAVGIFVLLSSDSAESVVADVHYKGTPGSVVRVEMTLGNGTVDGKTKPKPFVLSHDGNRRLLIRRSAPDADITVIANAPQLADSAMSVWPLPPNPPVVPNIHDHSTPSTLVSLNRPTRASSGKAAAAVDGNVASAYNALAGPPQWVEVQLDGPHDIDRVELIPEQTPNGLTRHIVSGIRSNGQTIVIEDVTSVTASGARLTVVADSPKGEGWDLVAVRVDTVMSPSWVAWREISVLGWKL